MLFFDLNILPFKKLVIHRMLQMFKSNLGYVPIIARSDLFASNSAIHIYSSTSCALHMAFIRISIYSNFVFVGIQIWNYILDNLDVLYVTFPNFKNFSKLISNLIILLCNVHMSRYHIIHIYV